MRTQLSSIAFENKESIITVDSLKDYNKGLTQEIALLKVVII